MRRLTPQEIAGYDLVPAVIARRARVQKVPLLAPGTHGMTLSSLVLLLRDDDRSGRRTLLAHELVHVEQYAQLGVVRFLRRYLREYFVGLWRVRDHRQAYESVSFEADARAAVAQWAADLTPSSRDSAACARSRAEAERRRKAQYS